MIFQFFGDHCKAKYEQDLYDEKCKVFENPCIWADFWLAGMCVQSTCSDLSIRMSSKMSLEPAKRRHERTGDKPLSNLGDSAQPCPQLIGSGQWQESVANMVHKP